MSNPYKFLDPAVTGKLVLDTRAATSSQVLSQNGVNIGMKYTWSQINWQPPLRMQPETAGFVGWEVEHEFVGTCPAVGFTGTGLPVVNNMQQMATTMLIASNLNTSSYCPNNYGIQGVMNASSVFCTATVGATGGINTLIHRDSLSKGVFFVKRPDTYTDVSVTMFVPTTTTNQVFGPTTISSVVITTDDITTASVHTFTFKCIRQKS